MRSRPATTRWPQGQHEIDFKYADALRTADNIMTFKLAVKTLAQKNGLHATFMPKPIFGIDGSGMHTNMSLFRDGKNVFYDPADPTAPVHAGLSASSPACWHHVQGMACRHQSAGELLQAAGARLRGPLLPGLVRLQPLRPDPHSRAAGTGHPGGAALPRPRLQPLSGPGGVPCRRTGRHRAADDAPRRSSPSNIFVTRCPETPPASQRLPGSLEEAVRALEADSVITDALGAHVTEQYLAGKRREWDGRTAAQVSQWELEQYLVGVLTCRPVLTGPQREEGGKFHGQDHIGVCL